MNSTVPSVIRISACGRDDRSKRHGGCSTAAFWRSKKDLPGNTPMMPLQPGNLVLQSSPVSPSWDGGPSDLLSWRSLLWRASVGAPAHAFARPGRRWLACAFGLGGRGQCGFRKDRGEPECDSD